MRSDSFTKLYNAVVDYWWSLLGPTETHILILLMCRLTVKGPLAGTCVASYREIAAASGMSTTAVSLAIKKLIQRGLISVKAGANQHARTTFRINEGALWNPVQNGSSDNACGIEISKAVPFLGRNSSGTAAEQQCP